jgi:hypothetical protein
MNDDQDDKKFQMMPASDITTLVVALAFLAGFLWLMFGPSPFAGLTETAKPAPPQEVIVTLPAKAK